VENLQRSNIATVIHKTKQREAVLYKQTNEYIRNTASERSVTLDVYFVMLSSQNKPISVLSEATQSMEKHTKSVRGIRCTQNSQTAEERS
jgi:hypothetical protein